MKTTFQRFSARTCGHFAISSAALLSAFLIVGVGGVRAQQLAAVRGDSLWERYEARATATQNMQPHWVTPLVTVTPRLEQEFRTDFLHFYTPNGKEIWNYDNGKGLELIPEKHTEILINLPPFFDRSTGQPDGFGDVSFMMKERLYARNEEHGNGIVTFFFGGSVPTGKNGNGICCAVVTPTLAMGKGYGLWSFTTTAGGSLPVTNAKGVGHVITWNSVLQYHGAKKGMGRYWWPEIESNDSFYKGAANDGKTVAYVTPGVLIGRVPLLPHAMTAAGKRLGLTFGAGEQIALTHFNTYNHATILTVRIPF